MRWETFYPKPPLNYFRPPPLSGSPGGARMMIRFAKQTSKQQLNDVPG